jgi:ABC-type phosphate/phosphonate transport system permease subunit
MDNFLLNDIEDDIVSLYFIVNDFSNWYDDVYGKLHEKQKKNPTREPCIAECEMMTILLLFFQSYQKFFKHFYNNFKTYNKKFFDFKFTPCNMYDRKVLKDLLSNFTGTVLAIKVFCFFLNQFLVF